MIGTAVAGATAERLGEDAKLERSLTTDSLLAKVAERASEAEREDGRRDGRGRDGRHATPREPRRGDRAVAEQAGARRRPGAALGDRRGRNVQRDPGAGPDRGAERGPSRRAALGTRRVATDPRGQSEKALAQYVAHEQLHIADTREQAAEQMVAGVGEGPCREPGEADGDADRRLEHRARQDQPESPGTARSESRAGSRAGAAPRRAVQHRRRR